MKKYVISFFVLLMFIFTSCLPNERTSSNRPFYDEGYEKEYYDEWYEKGYSDGAADARFEAVHYASDHGGWHPEEAMYIIEEYSRPGSKWTEDDYESAIKSLYYFYDYFYQGYHLD